MKLRDAPALALLGWYLLVPAAAPQSGAANADPYPTASIWSSYKTLEDCERERQSLAEDPVVGPRMKAAKCLQTPPADSSVKPK